MTDGTSQGLFIVVAIVIFGIFVVLAYILFEDTLSPSMNGLFGDSIEMTNMNINSVKYYGESGIRPNPASDFEAIDTIDGTGKIITKYLNTTDKDVVIPWEIDGKPVTTIGDSSFEGRFSFKLDSVKLPNTVTSVGIASFYGNSIKNLFLQGSIKTIGIGAFGKNHMERLIMEVGVEMIDANAFSENMLTEVKIPSSVTTLHSDAFSENPSELILK